MGSVTPLFVHAAEVFFLSWCFLTALLWLARRYSRLYTPIWAVLLLLMPYVLVKNWAIASGAVLPYGLFHHETFFVLGLLLPLVIIAVSALAIPRAIRLIGRLEHFISEVLGFSSIFAFLMLLQLLWFGWKARNLNPPPQLHRPSVSSVSQASRPRIIWIILDELSYQQVYGQRYPGLELPAFDALAAQSTVFTHTVPEGESTQIVVPSLMTGIHGNDIRVSSSGRLVALKDADSRKWRPFDPHQTVFQDALNHGYSTAIAGWYNPYCRILPQVLDHCFWTLWGSGVSNQIGDYQKLLSSGDALLADPSIGFVLLHMPVPHPVGIYNRHRGIFAPGGSYIDNLALADQYLAHVHRLLAQQGAWDSSTIVVMGDHSWRTSFVWTTFPGWTAEDERASHGGKFDDRPAYVVKLPNQQNAAHIDSRFGAWNTRALFDALLANRIHNSSDLEAWVEQQNR